ncbi:MAG: 50S ribosomal protein L10 [Deltaproteobacteria bacterium]|nr:50S ribosomal protein L10 [Deltaproteobacteria bacterium]MBW2661700.1 50S ribosomal protein L10 [Deltaproteobacteria bacterium]
MKIDKKKTIVEDLRKRFSKSKAVFVTDYKGLDVATTSVLRRKLRETNSEYKVVKNSLLVKASEESDIALIKEYFKGPSAIALSYNDPVAIAKVLVGFAEKNEKLGIKIGIMDGKLLDLSAIKALSILPSRDVLLGQLLSVMAGVPTAFVRVLADAPKRMLNVLQAIKEQKEAA